METHLTKYGPGGQYPAKRIPGSKWVIIDATGWNWRQKEEWPEMAIDGTASSYDIHFDDDDLFFVPARPEDFYPIPGAKKLAAAYNAPYTKNMRWRIERARNYESSWQIIGPHIRASQLLSLARMIRENQEDQAISGDFDWSPSGVVWENGERIFSNVF